MMTCVRPAAVLVFAVVFVLPGVAGGQPPPPEAAVQQGGLRGLPPEVLQNIVASAQPDTPATLTLLNRPIVVFRASVLNRSAADRVATAKQVLTAFASQGRPLVVGSRELAGGVLVTVDGRDIIALVPADNDVLAGETLESKAQETVRRLQQALDESLEMTRPRVVLLRLAQALGATVAFLVVLWLLGRLYRRIADAVERRTKETLAAHKVTDELARQTRVMQYLRRAVLGVVGLLGLTVTYLWSTFVLQLFPYTRPWGETLRAFLIAQAVGLGSGALAALPSLFTVLLIVLLTRLAIRIVNLLFAGVEAGRISLPGVYPETAGLTQKLTIALLWLFALIVSYPYLPGSQTDAFKGISVFIGLIISLGSSGLMNQVMSGFTVTYSRALRRGDFVRVGEIEGTVTHIGTLSTKIETPRREEVTIPNAVLVSQTVTNYSRNADSTGVYTSTSVTIGYDVPWRQIEALLLLAASRTEGVRTAPPPVVLQSGLEDFYVRYTLLVALEMPQRRAPILNRLHANIQDAFNEHGVQIMSPNYEADPENRKVVPKDQWFAAPATSTQNAARITSQS